MKEIKSPASYTEQIEKLRSRGCIINDYTFCEQVLNNVSYYRLSAYFLPYKNQDGKYNNGLEFETIYNIYEFYRKLRELLFMAIEEIEVSLRARLSYFHSKKYGPLGYLDASSFNNKHDSVRFRLIIEREIKNNQKVLFVKHHILNYGGQFPLWVISELFTFGTISRFYDDLYTSDKKKFAGKNYKEMISWLRCCTDLRNICAHYGRLYNRRFSALPAGFDISEYAKRRLWGVFLVVKELYPFTNKWNLEFIPKIKALFKEYDSYINLYHLGFPDKWCNKLVK